MQALYQQIVQVVAQVTSYLKPWLMLAGVALAAALGIDAFVTRVPLIDGGQGQMLLAALLVYAGR